MKGREHTEEEKAFHKKLDKMSLLPYDTDFAVSQEDYNRSREYRDHIHEIVQPDIYYPYDLVTTYEFDGDLKELVMWCNRVYDLDLNPLEILLTRNYKYFFLKDFVSLFKSNVKEQLA